MSTHQLDEMSTMTRNVHEKNKYARKKSERINVCGRERDQNDCIWNREREQKRNKNEHIIM